MVAECLWTTCPDPECQTRPHMIQVYVCMPKISCNDGSLMVGVGLCQQTGAFIWRLNGGGWAKQVAPSIESAEFLGVDECEDVGNED